MQDTNASTPPPAPVVPPTTERSATTTGSAVTMTIAKYKDMILETIDQLRQRKARPDLERISHMLQRKHGISFRETEAILGKLVDSQVVFKVDYKGSTSYRNAAKWRINHLASSGSIGGLTQNSDQVKQKLREAVRALAVGCGNSSSSGNSSVNNNTSSNSSGNASGGSRKGRPQPNNDASNSGTHAAASGDKKSNSTTPNDALNNVDAEASTTGATTKKGNSTGRADEASTHAHTTSSESRNNNSKSPASGNATPGASATIPPTNQTPTSKRGGNKKEYTGPVGITLKDLENWLTKQDSENLLVKNLLVTALQREVHAGWLKRLRNGNYIDVASIASNSKKRSGNNKGNAKNTSSSSGASVSSAMASTTVTSTPSSVSSTISLPSESSTAKGNTKPTTTTTTNTTNNNNNIIVFTNSANSTPNNATLITTTTCTPSPTISSSSSPPTNTSFAPQPAKPNHGTKRSASAASLNSFQTASQQLISSSTPTLLPTSDVTTQGQHGATLVLFPSSSPTTSAGHPALLLPVSSTQAPNDSGDRRTALLTTTSSTAASPFPSSSSSLSSVYSPSGSTYHNNNALARVSLSSTSTTQTSTVAAAAAAAAAATGTPGLSRESAPTARRDNNNAKPAKSAAPQPAGPTNAPVPVKRGRPASRRKRFKKTPGPEFETDDILKFVPEKCVTCCLTAQANKHGEPEDLLVCKDCNTTVHPSCLDYCEELAVKARNSPWQCIECKTCYVCDDSGDGDSMLFCDACDKGYHMKCHVPGVDQKPKGKWVCGQCVSENENAVEQPMEFEASNSEGSRASSPSATGIHLEPMEASGPSCLPTPCDSPVQPDPEEKEIGREDASISLPMLRDFQGPYPDAANWTIDDVVNFFKSAGFVSQAEAFREQEIDGKSLLLMKRSDVLTGLSLKLGPALKMYTHVQNLQLVGQSSFVSGIGH